MYMEPVATFLQQTKSRAIDSISIYDVNVYM